MAISNIGSNNNEDEKHLPQSKEKESLDLEANQPTPYGHLDQPPPHTTSLLKNLENSLFLQKYLSYPPPNSLEIKSTSWLDGVRGIAAFLVYLFHAMGCWANIVPAYGSDPIQTNIFQLPFIRTIFVSGGASVSVFFALSGYVLTYKSLRWVRSGSSQRVAPTIYSSMFRRGFRLYLPPILLTFIEMLFTRLGFPPALNFTFVPEKTFVGQVLDWVKETNYLINPLHNSPRAIRGFVTHPKYDSVIWTIPLEFYGSFICYFLLLLLAKLPSNTARILLVSLLALFSMGLGSWNTFCFLSGLLIANFNLAQEETGIPLSTMPRMKGLAWTAVFVLSFYVAGFPALSVGEADIKPMPGFETLRFLIPKSLNMEDHARFWWSISGVSLLLSISQLPRLKKLFETNLCQYLGKISFSLYLVHVFCTVLFGLGMQRAMLGMVGIGEKAGTMGYWIVGAVWFVLFTGVVFGIAGVVEREVDRRSVGFARGVERWVGGWWRGGK